MALRLGVLNFVRVNTRRHLTLSAVALQQKVAADPIQQLFVDKVREYANKKKASGGKLVKLGYSRFSKYFSRKIL
jgi:F-type H+-transporting ATPase subunit 6